jgi:hypothetical protein
MWERATLFWEWSGVYVTFLAVRAVKPVCKSCRKVRIAIHRGNPTLAVMTVEGMNVLVQRSGELLVLTMCGVMTLRGAAGVRAALLKLLTKGDARAVVVDMREAIPLFSVGGWCELAANQESGQIAPPVAIVVTPRYEQALRAYCLAMAHRGLVRGPFVGLHGAVEWASRRREHWEHRPSRSMLASGSQTPPPAQIPHGRLPASPAVGHPSPARS